MRNPTKRQRNSIYKKILIRLHKSHERRQNLGLCLILCDLPNLDLWNVAPAAQYINQHLPELSEHKPTNRWEINSCYWFDPNSDQGYKDRVRILKSCIKQTETKK